MALKFVSWNSARDADLERSMADQSVELLKEEPKQVKRPILMVPPLYSGFSGAHGVAAGVPSARTAVPEGDFVAPEEPWTEEQEREWSEAIQAGVASVVSGKERAAAPADFTELPAKLEQPERHAGTPRAALIR